VQAKFLESEMAVYIDTNEAAALFDLFKIKVEQREAEGKITTWKLSNDKQYFTHAAKQWEYAAWMKPSVENGRLAFYIIKPRNKDVSQTAYGFYHGHMIETFLNHFDLRFDSAQATALPEALDKVS
jgi:hypothetical protein